MIGSLLTIAAAVFWLLPNGPVEPRLPLSIFGPLLLIAGSLSWKYYEPADKRSVRLAVSVYLFLGIAITAGGLIQQFAPDPDAGVAVAGQTATTVAPVVRPPLRTPPLTRRRKEKRRPRRSAPRSARLNGRSGSPKRKQQTEKEQRIMTSGSYWEAVKLRGGRFPEKAADDFGFAIIFTGMFLLGTWFVRSGVMENTGAHLSILSEAGPVWHASWDRARVAQQPDRHVSHAG